MEKVQNEDVAAFEELMNRHLRPVHAYTYRMCQSVQIAEEIAQETFMRVWTKSQSWIPNRVQFTTWLFQIARNLCIDSFRKRRAVFDPDADITQIPDHSPKIDQTMAIAIQQAVAKLPERQRTAFMLCQIQGWSQAEAAAMMETTPEAIDSLISRARRTLRTILTSDKYHLNKNTDDTKRI